MRNIISNAKAQGQKIYNSAKSLILEDDLINNSLNRSIDKVGIKNEKDYINAIKSLKDMGDTEGIDGTILNKFKGLQKTPSDMSILKKSLSEDQISKVGQAVSNRLGTESYGASYTNIDKTYGELMKKTKGAIGMNMPGSIANSYYINPIKDGISSMKSTKFKDNTDLHKGMARVGGTALGAYATGKVVAGTNDEDIKDINKRMKAKYDQGKL